MGYLVIKGKIIWLRSSTHPEHTVQQTSLYSTLKVKPHYYVHSSAPHIRVREAPVRVCVLTLAGARWAVPRWFPGPLDGTGCGCSGPCSPGWPGSAAGWTRPPWAGSHSLRSEAEETQHGPSCLSSTCLYDFELNSRKAYVILKVKKCLSKLNWSFQKDQLHTHWESPK